MHVAICDLVHVAVCELIHIAVCDLVHVAIHRYHSNFRKYFQMLLDVEAGETQSPLGHIQQQQHGKKIIKIRKINSKTILHDLVLKG